MRADMAKVIVERPRLGARYKTPKSYPKRRQREGLDARKREGIRRPWAGCRKMLNEHLGPLRRYLWKQQGRPWNKVFAEISRHIRLDSAVQSHVLDHLSDFVEVQVRLVDGQPLSTGGYRVGRPVHPSRLYVCPRTGILRSIKQKRQPRTPCRVDVSKALQYHMIDGVWHEVALRPIPVDAACCFDAVLNRPVARSRSAEAVAKYGLVAYALSKRPLTERELRRLRKQFQPHRR
jgi:hypothetical protein